MAKEICVWLVAGLMVIATIRYVYQVRRKDISPTLSTWIIFLLGTGLSLATYAIAEKHDFRSGILNTIDVISVSMIVLAILMWGKRNVFFAPFERWYLAGVGMILVYGIVFGDAWRSNIFTQILITIGYAPTIQKLLTDGRDTESLTAWSLVLSACIIALYPASQDGNVLAVLYALRAVVMVSFILIIIVYHKLRTQESYR